MERFHYKFRLTPSKSENPNSFSDLLELLDSSFDEYAYVRETATELHYHFYIVTYLDDAKFRYKLRKILGTGGSKGNAVFSLTKLVFDHSGYALEYLSYMQKTKTPIWHSDSFPKKVIEEAGRMSLEFDKEREKRKPKSIIKQLYELFEEEFKYDEHSERWLDSDSQCANSNNVLSLVINYFKEKECPIRESSIISYTQTLLLKYDPTYGDNLHSRLIEKI